MQLVLRCYANGQLGLPGKDFASVAEFIDQVVYAIELMGIDHVGISSDFDGGGELDGWSNASESLNLTRELLSRGYNEDQIGKIWGGNLLRVWAEVERQAN